MMGEDSRAAFLAELTPDTRAVDELVQSAYQLLTPLSEEDRDWLCQDFAAVASNAPGTWAAAVALYFLADPEVTLDRPGPRNACDILVLDYPNLALTRWAVRLPILRLNSNPHGANLACSGSLATEAQPGPEHLERLQKDPFVSKLKPIVPRLMQDSDRRQALKDIIDVLSKEEDWEVRYGLLRMVERHLVSSDLEPYAPMLAPAVRKLAEQSEATPDRSLARLWMCRLARQDRDREGVTQWLECLSNEQERVAEAYDLNLFGEAVKESGASKEWLEHKASLNSAGTE
jgi:hypothetical protein